MGQQGWKILTEIALQAGLLFLFAGSLFSLVYGVALFLGSRWAFSLNESTKRWISTREALRPLDLPHSVDPFLYRWHTWFGSLIALGSAYVLYVAFFGASMSSVARLFAARPGIWAQMLTQFSWWFFVVGAAGGLVLGLLLALRPGVLKAAEAWAGRSYSARRSTKPLEIMHLSGERWLLSHPRASGAAIALGSVYVMWILATVLFSNLLR
jgi:hypothetical protein